MHDSVPGMPNPFGAPKDNDDEFSVDLSGAPTGGGFYRMVISCPGGLRRIQQEWKSG